MKPNVDPVFRYNLLILLMALIFLLLGVPLIGDSTLGRGFWRGGLTLVVILAAMATQRTKQMLFVGVLAAIIMAPLNWITLASDKHYLFLAACVFESVYLAVMAILLLVAVIRKHLATIESIYGAICAYLLLGLAWAMIYLGLSLSAAGEWTINGVSFNESSELGEVHAFSQMIYFSFVTMSTLGYGDMTPETVLVQTLTWMQSVSGQFYIAVLVAWLVSEIPRRQTYTSFEQRITQLEAGAAEKHEPPEERPQDDSEDR